MTALALATAPSAVPALPIAGAIYISAKDLVGLPGFPASERRCREAAKRLALPCRPRAGLGGGLEYRAESLPPAARMALASRGLQPSASVNAAPAARASASARAMHVTGWQKERQEARARLLVIFQRFWQAFGGPLTPAIEAFCIGWNAGRIEADASLKQGFPNLAVSTLRGWHVGVEQSGLQAITPPEHHRKGMFDALSGALGDATIALLTQRPHISVSAVVSILQRQFQGQLQMPSERAFRRAICYWKQQNSQLFLGITNPDAWRNQYMSAAGSASEGIKAPNQRWEMDSTPGDVLLSDGKRHAIIGVIDVFTRRRLFSVVRTSKSAGVMSLIRRAIAEWGMPDLIKTDNGRDYTADQLEHALLGLGIEHALCQPFTPQEKPFVERAIGALMHEHFELLDGYIGHSVADRKDIEARRSFADRLFDKDDAIELRLSPEQLQASIEVYCERRLHKPMSSLGGRSPAQMLAAAQTAGFAPMSISERALDVLLAPSAFKAAPTVGKKGVRIGGGNYNHKLLGGMEGTKVQAKVDEANLGHAYIFTMDGVFVCEALDYERLGINSAEVASSRKSHQAKLLRESKRQLRDASRQFDTRAAIAAITLERTDAAVDAGVQAGNVVSLAQHRQPAELMHTSAAIASIEAADQPLIQEAELAAAQARLTQAAQQRSAQIVRLADTAQTRYARWLKLQERVQANEQLASAEAAWLEAYAQGGEHASMKKYFENFGLTADQVLSGT